MVAKMQLLAKKYSKGIKHEEIEILGFEIASLVAKIRESSLEIIGRIQI